MDYDRLKNSVKTIEMPEGMKNRIIKNCYSGGMKDTNEKNNSHYSYRTPARKRAFAFAIAIVICITISVPALSASIPAVYDLLYSISPGTAQFFRPVQMSCEDNGISLEVISAYIEDDTAQIYIAMQDLTGDRVDGTTDLFDSYSINTGFDCSAHCELVSYDAEANEATFLISITQWGERKIEEEKITFSVKDFLSNKQEFDGALLEVDLSNLGVATDTHSPTEIRGGGGICYNEFIDNLTALSPSGSGYSPINGVIITGAGYIDGYLHIQAHFENILETDNHGYIYLQNYIEEKVESLATVSFWDAEKKGSYTEFIFSIPQNEIGNYTLFGHFITSGTLTEGQWEVTFPLESVLCQ